MSRLSRMINPFDAEQKLVCLASGFVVQEDVADKALEAQNMEQFVKFRPDNLLSTRAKYFCQVNL